MRPLLWKEMRDLRPWLALAAGSVIALQLLCRSRAFEESFMGVYLLGLMPLTATLASIALGAGQVARERHAHTLDFLLARPLPAATLVWTKFLAGSIALALLIAALVALGYGNPDYTGETGVTAIRGAVGSAGLLLALFPRFWFLYAIALLLSVLCDRTAKAAAALAVVALTFLGFALSWSDLAPFSGLPSWLPFFDNTGALVRVARDSSLLFGTGLPLCAAALLVTWAAATRLKHSPASYFGNRALLLGAAALIGAAVLAARISGDYLPVTHPAGALTLPLKEAPSDFAASGTIAALAIDDGATFFDFSDAAHPRILAELHLPLWISHRIALYGSDVYLTGTRKTLPHDELQIVPARLNAATVEPGTPIALGPPDPNGFIGTPLRAGNFLYVSSVVNRQCQVRLFDLAAARELPAITVDTLRPGSKGGLTMALRAPYLYVASPASLTTIDLAHAEIASRIAYHDTIPLLYGVQRPLLIFGDTLYEEALWPQSLRAFSLRDPRRPAPDDDRTWHRTGSGEAAATATALYQPWRGGVLAFHPHGRAFSALRNLSEGPMYNVHDFAISGDELYTLGWDRNANSQRVAVFHLAYPADRPVGREPERSR